MDLLTKLRKREKEKFNFQDIAVLPQILDTPVIYQDLKLEASQDQNLTEITQDQKLADTSPDQNLADITQSQILPDTRQNQLILVAKQERNFLANAQNPPVVRAYAKSKIFSR